MIPKIIHQFWDRPEPPPDVARLIEWWRNRHRNWTHILWQDTSARSFIEAQFGTEAARCYSACTIPAMRSNVLRIAAAVVFGGAYVDADARPRWPLEGLRKLGGCRLYEIDGHVSDEFFMTPPRHPFFVSLWDFAIDAIANRRFDTISKICGPRAFDDTYYALSASDAATVTLMDWDEIRPFLKPSVPISTHQVEGHWLDLQRKGNFIVFE